MIEKPNSFGFPKNVSHLILQFKNIKIIIVYLDRKIIMVYVNYWTCPKKQNTTG
ncbi:hypothetical protein LZ11_02195 [Thermosediminibacter litoriperuensis]|uniref:Uncharacterized protein n=1 Tax=Thermosediminibacter litoriperuensis TaxID=291989 RepID=A0A5S5AJA6_9FIRM|nr:hypothetical protein LZ11_02195 [Thermosediminibacter litoriperuensis]